jgi:hypothetical protein
VRSPSGVITNAVKTSKQPLLLPHPVRMGALRLHVRLQQFLSPPAQMPPLSNSELRQLRLHEHCAHAEAAHQASSVTASVAATTAHTVSIGVRRRTPKQSSKTQTFSLSLVKSATCCWCTTRRSARSRPPGDRSATRVHSFHQEARDETGLIDGERVPTGRFAD